MIRDKKASRRSFLNYAVTAVVVGVVVGVGGYYGGILSVPTEKVTTTTTLTASPAATTTTVTASPAVTTTTVTASPGLKSIKVALPGNYMAMLPVFVAAENGIFEKYGLKVDYSIMASDIIPKALVAGEIDIAETAAAEVIVGVKGGVPYRYVFSRMLNTFFVLMVAEDSQIKTAEDLKKTGIVIGDVSPVSITCMYAHFLAKYLGMDAWKDWEIVHLGPPPAYLAALKEKTVDAVIQSIDLGITWRAQKAVRIILEFKDITGPVWEETGTAAHLDLIQKNPGTLALYLQSLRDAIQFIRDNPGETKQVITKIIKPAGEVLDEVYDTYSPLYSTDGAISVEGIESVGAAMVDARMIEAPPPIQDLYTLKFVSLRR